jgi:hypothetical protein
MLRVVIEQLADTVRLDLHGTLGGQWVPLVERHWRSIVNGHRVAPKITVSLSDVDFIDADGARLLRRMADGGAEFVVSGCMNRYVIETLQPAVRTTQGEGQMTTKTTTPDLQAYEDAIVAKIHAANVQIDQFEAAAKSKRATAEIAAVNALKTARAGIERNVKDLQTAQAAHVARAKADIDAAAVKLEKALEDFRQKYTMPGEER